MLIHALIYILFIHLLLFILCFLFTPPTQVCYNSCPACDPLTSCEWTSCYDDLAYTLALIEKVDIIYEVFTMSKVTSEYCVDLDSIHQSGMSNGAMFSYILAASTDVFATFGPVAGAPNLGYLNPPMGPIRWLTLTSTSHSLIDLHGTEDDTIPYDIHSPECVGEGPHGTLIAFDGFYYYPKARVKHSFVSSQPGIVTNPMIGQATVIATYVSALECLPGVPWPTFMDGVQGFACTIYSGLLSLYI